jgi:hypothetical protein
MSSRSIPGNVSHSSCFFKILLRLIGRVDSGAETAYPRLSMITDLIAALTTYPTLSRTATAALLEMCEAMRLSATEAETEVLLSGMMAEEVHVRFACLQAIQVSRYPLNLTGA